MRVGYNNENIDRDSILGTIINKRTTRMVKDNT